MIVFGPSYNPFKTPDFTGDNAVVGIGNLVTSTNILADYALPTNPVTNLANPSTALTWKSGATILQYVTATLSGVDPVDYLAVEGHNFFTASAAVNAQGWSGGFTLGSNMRNLTQAILSEAGYPILTEAGSIILNEATQPHIGDMTASGGLAAAFDNTTSQAAAACAVKAATSGYVGSDYTSQPGRGKRIYKATCFGSNDQGYSSTGAGASITLNLYGKTGTTAPANATDGTLLGTLAFTNLANESSGRDITSSDQDTLFGFLWIQVVAGSGNVTLAEAQLYESLENWVDLTTAVTPTDNLPMIFKFNIQSALQKVRLKIGAGNVPIVAAVLYAGQSLVFQRRVYVGHTPMTMGRSTTVVTGMSESGNFLGRIVTGETRKTTVALGNLAPDWYRNNMDGFIKLAVTVPFFFAWRPVSYPAETGYAWLQSDAVPVNQSPNGLMSVQLSLAGVAA
jgi:hypothetical protein